jgi:hypothetical protein
MDQSWTLFAKAFHEYKFLGLYGRNVVGHYKFLNQKYHQIVVSSVLHALKSLHNSFAKYIRCQSLGIRLSAQWVQSWFALLCSFYCTLFSAPFVFEEGECARKWQKNEGRWGSAQKRSNIRKAQQENVGPASSFEAHRAPDLFSLRPDDNNDPNVRAPCTQKMALWKKNRSAWWWGWNFAERKLRSTPMFRCVLKL